MLDEDVAALIESERARTGESFRDALNRLLRRSAKRSGTQEPPPPLPRFKGAHTVDIADVSSASAREDDEHLLGGGAFVRQRQ